MTERTLYKLYGRDGIFSNVVEDSVLSKEQIDRDVRFFMWNHHNEGIVKVEVSTIIVSDDDDDEEGND